MPNLHYYSIWYTLLISTQNTNYCTGTVITNRTAISTPRLKGMAEDKELIYLGHPEDEIKT